MPKPITTAVAFLLIASLAAGCDAASRVSGPAAPTSPRASAFVDQTNTQDFPYTFSDVNPCNADVFTLTGTSHVITHASLDGMLGIHFDDHFISNATGTGTAPAFKEYSGKADDRFQTEALDPTTVLNVSHRMLVRGPTREDDFFVHFLFHVTVNANGVPTAFVDKMDTRCND